MTVIDFPRRNKPAPINTEPTPKPPEGPDLGDTLETAIEVHQMIMNCFNMDGLRENPDAIGSVLTFAMSHHFGPDLVLWAEQQFEAVYGVHPFTFIDHVASYLP